jgi:hypothetical protein
LSIVSNTSDCAVGAVFRTFGPDRDVFFCVNEAFDGRIELLICWFKLDLVAEDEQLSEASKDVWIFIQEEARPEWFNPLGKLNFLLPSLDETEDLLVKLGAFYKDPVISKITRGT